MSHQSRPSEATATRIPTLAGLPALILTLALAFQANGQSNPVYIDDSPQARELLQQAADQRRDNIAETLRLYQELLDVYGAKLAPVSPGARDHFVNVRSLVRRTILTDAELLERYRIAAAGEAARLFENGQYEQLAATRSLTEPGLDALLRMAQQDVEAGRFESALTILEEAREHPDFTGRRAAHGWHLTGLASHFLSQTSLRTDALNALEQLGGVAAELRTSLEETSRRAPQPALSRALDRLVSASSLVESLSDLVSEPIWSASLINSPLSRRFMDILNGADQGTMDFYNRHRRDGQLATVMPAVAGDLVLINEGHRITAFNRISGREQWHYLDRSNIAARETPDLDRARDPNYLRIADGRVVTLTGHARDSERTNRGRMICLDLETGELLWTISLDRIGGIDDHDDLFPYGEPVISEGVVSVLARKVTDQFLTSDYLVGVRLEDGAFLWSQHIASTGGIRRSNERPFSTPLLDGGTIYIASPLGATASVDAQRGSVRWLLRFDVPIMLSSLADEQDPWQIGRPALTTNGLFALEPDLRRVALIDDETGALIQSLTTSSSDGWARPTYLLANEHSVYAIGHEVRAFRLESLETPIWVLDLAAATTMTEPDAAPRATNRPTVRGRVGAVDGALVVPTLDGVLVVDDETGQIVQRLASNVATNPAVAEGQIFAAGSAQLNTYMSFRRAEEILRARLASSPDAVEPALSLLRLGLRVADLKLVLEAAGLTVQSISLRELDQQTVAYRAELFDLLLEARRQDLARTRDDGEALFAILGSVATGPEQRVGYLLDYADWLVDHSIERAVETFQTVLSDPQLAMTPLHADERIRPAADWTTDRLQQLMADHGAQAYAPQADFARLRLTQLLDRPQRDADDLLALAHDFPLAPASVDATLAAADELAGAGRHRDAVAAIAESLRSGLNEPTSRRRLLSRIVRVCLDAGWPDQAASMLDRFIVRYGDVELDNAGVAIAASDWRTQIAGARAGNLPVVGDVQGDLILDLRGQLVEPAPMARIERRPILLFEDGMLAMYDRPEGESKWTAALEPTMPRLLAADEKHVLLWQQLSPDRHVATLLDREQGTEIWRMTPLTEALDRGGALSRTPTINERMPNGEPFDSRDVIPFATRDAVIAVHRSGEVVAIDRRDGASLMWAIPEGLEQVHHAALIDGALVLAGAHREPEARNGRGDLVPMVVTIDPSTGEVVTRIRPAGIGGVRWMTLDPFGRAALGSGDLVELLDVFTGRRLWSQVGYAAFESADGWSTPRGVLVQSRIGQLHHVNEVTGAMTTGFEENVRAELRARDLRDAIVVGDAIFARYQSRVIRYDEHGSVRGADVILDGSHEYRWLLPAEQRLVLISSSSSQRNDGRGRQQRRTVYDYRISLLSDTCRLIGEYELPQFPQRITHVDLADGWLMLCSETTTFVIPMPAGD